MGKIFTITNEIRQVAQDAFDDLIDQLSRPCRVVYPPKMIRCDNCRFDPIGKKSANIWQNGGPVQFPYGSICPSCNGAGFRHEVVSDIVNMLINENVKTFDTSFKVIDIPDGVIQTKFYSSDLPKIMKCDYIVKDINTENYLEQKYKLKGEPIMPGNIIQRRYVIALWRRHN